MRGRESSTIDCSGSQLTKQIEDGDDLGEDEHDREIRVGISDDVVNEEGNGIADDADRSDYSEEEDTVRSSNVLHLPENQRAEQQLGDADDDRHSEHDRLVDQSQRTSGARGVVVDRAEERPRNAGLVKHLEAIREQDADEEHDDEEGADEEGDPETAEIFTLGIEVEEEQRQADLEVEDHVETHGEIHHEKICKLVRVGLIQHASGYQIEIDRSDGEEADGAHPHHVGGQPHLDDALEGHLDDKDEPDTGSDAKQSGDAIQTGKLAARESNTVNRLSILETNDRRVLLGLTSLERDQPTQLIGAGLQFGIHVEGSNGHETIVELDPPEIVNRILGEVVKDIRAKAHAKVELLHV